QHTGVDLSVGQRISLNIELVPASLKQQVTVTAQPPSISPSETMFTTTVDHERIEESPVRTRNLLDFVLLAPGVAGANQQQVGGPKTPLAGSGFTDRKSTRLNSSHLVISYAVFCLKKKKNKNNHQSKS